MRNVLLTFALLLCFAFSADAQIKVITSGDTGINNSTPTAALHINSRGTGTFPLRVTSSTGVDMFEVNQGGVGSGNFFIYDAGGTRTIQFAGQGKFYVSSPGNVGIDQNNPTFDFEIGTAAGGSGVAAKPGGGMWTATSDARSKSTIDAFSAGLDEVLQIRPVVYEYNGKFGTPKNGKKYVGVVAQELQEVASFMVSENTYNDATLEEMESPDYVAEKYEENFLAVDPTAFTYMLINSVQEQQAMIEAQNERIAEMEAMILDLANGTTTQAVEIKDSRLGQNAPNPFNQSTVINYTVPTKSNTAVLQIFDMNGQMLKAVNVANGNGQLTINAGELAAGTYSYNLVVDGAVVDTKKMVLTK